MCLICSHNVVAVCGSSCCFCCCMPTHYNYNCILSTRECVQLQCTSEAKKKLYIYMYMKIYTDATTTCTVGEKKYYNFFFFSHFLFLIFTGFYFRFCWRIFFTVFLPLFHLLYPNALNIYIREIFFFEFYFIVLFIFFFFFRKLELKSNFKVLEICCLALELITYLIKQ